MAESGGGKDAGAGAPGFGDGRASSCCRRAAVTGTDLLVVQADWPWQIPGARCISMSEGLSVLRCGVNVGRNLARTLLHWSARCIGWCKVTSGDGCDGFSAAGHRRVTGRGRIGGGSGSGQVAHGSDGVAGGRGPLGDDGDADRPGLGEDVPARVRPSLYTHIARIRRTLADSAVPVDTDTGVAAVGSQLRRGRGGYLLDVRSGWVDVHRFRRLVDQARAADRTDAERVVMLREALGLWRGEPLAGLAGAWVERTRHSWGQQRIEAVLAWSEAELRVGNPAGVIGMLNGLVAEHPLVEPLTVTDRLDVAGQDVGDGA